MSADAKAEVGRVGCAVDDDAAESSAVSAGRGENSADPLDGAEIGVAEGVVAFDRSVARAVFLEGPEEATGGDVADWLGIHERRIEVQRLTGRDGAQHQMRNVELGGQLAGLQGVDDELGVVGDDLADRDADFSALWPKLRRLLALLLGRNIENQVLHMDRIDVHGRAQKTANGGAKAE